MYLLFDDFSFFFVEIRFEWLKFSWREREIITWQATLFFLCLVSVLTFCCCCRIVVLSDWRTVEDSDQETLVKFGVVNWFCALIFSFHDFSFLVHTWLLERVASWIIFATIQSAQGKCHRLNLNSDHERVCSAASFSPGCLGFLSKVGILFLAFLF